MTSRIVLTPDKVSVRGPKIDGSYVISLDIGEYQQGEVAQVLMLPQKMVVTVTIEAK